MRLNIILFLLLTTILVFACSKKEKEIPLGEVVNDDREWKSMDAYHLILTEAFHPYSDSINLGPAKRLAEKLVSEIEIWTSLPLPEKVNNDGMKVQLTQLKTDTHSFAELVKEGAADDEIATSLNALHNSFHKVMETWNGGGAEPHQ